MLRALIFVDQVSCTYRSGFIFIYCIIHIRIVTNGCSNEGSVDKSRCPCVLLYYHQSMILQIIMGPLEDWNNLMCPIGKSEEETKSVHSQFHSRICIITFWSKIFPWTLVSFSLSEKYNFYTRLYQLTTDWLYHLITWNYANLISEVKIKLVV